MTQTNNINGPAKTAFTTKVRYQTRPLPSLIGTIGIANEAPVGKGNLKSNFDVGGGPYEAYVGAGLDYTHQFSDEVGCYVKLNSDKTIGIRDQVKYNEIREYNNGFSETYAASYPINTQRLEFGVGVSCKGKNGVEWKRGVSLIHSKAEIPTESSVNISKHSSLGAAFDLGLNIPDKWGATELKAQLGGDFKDNSGIFSFGVSRYF